MGKLNLFRKGRGKEYRQTKRAIKKAVKETGGFSATEKEGGGWNVSGATGGGTGNIYKGGQSKRRLARSAAEAMTSGIDKDSFLSDADKGSRVASGSIVGGKTRISGGGDSGDRVVDRKGFGWAGSGTKEGKKVYTENKVNVTGPSVENVRGQITKLEEKNPKISMKSTAFKMKYSPFNQGYGSPLNWNDRSPLNNLKKGDELVPSTKGVYMKESSPLNDKESCKSPKVWHNNKCWTAAAYKEEVSERTTDDDITETTTRTQTDLETGKKGKKGKKFTHTPGTEKQEQTFAERCAKYKKKNSAAAKADGCVWAEDEPDTPDTTEEDKLETKEVKAEGTATVITSKTECDKKSGYVWKNGECVGQAGDQDIESTTKCVRPKGGCPEGTKWGGKKECKCVPKISKEKQTKLDEKEKQKNIKKDKKDKLKKIKKDKKGKKGCECLEWDCE